MGVLTLDNLVLIRLIWINLISSRCTCSHDRSPISEPIYVGGVDRGGRGMRERGEMGRGERGWETGREGAGNGGRGGGVEDRAGGVIINDVFYISLC